MDFFSMTSLWCKHVCTGNGKWVIFLRNHFLRIVFYRREKIFLFLLDLCTEIPRCRIKKYKDSHQQIRHGPEFRLRPGKKNQGL